MIVAILFCLFMIIMLHLQLNENREEINTLEEEISILERDIDELCTKHKIVMDYITDNEK